MSNFHFELSQLEILVNLFIRVATAIIFLCFIIPLQIKEARVKNGLRLLRRELLVSGMTIFFINTVGLSIILFKYVFDDGVVQAATSVITLFNSLGFLVIAAMKYHMYHQQYTPENKRRHARIEQLEVEEEEQKRKEVKKHERKR